MPYYGRGGAGNIQAAAQEQARLASDTEAQLADTEQALSASASSVQDEQAYQRSGRGGAGNYFTASDDAKLPASQADIEAASRPMSPGKGPPKYGRGGAGNINYASGEKADQDAVVKDEEQKLQERVSKAAESFVEQEIQVPEKARLPTV